MSVKLKTDIYQLTKEALIYDIKPTPEHFARLAFLVRVSHCHVVDVDGSPLFVQRALCTAHKELPAQGKSKISFWEYVDKELELTRKEQKGQPVTFSAE